MILLLLAYKLSGAVNQFHWCEMGAETVTKGRYALTVAKLSKRLCKQTSVYLL